MGDAVDGDEYRGEVDGGCERTQMSSLRWDQRKWTWSVYMDAYRTIGLTIVSSASSENVGGHGDLCLRSNLQGEAMTHHVGPIDSQEARGCI